MNLVIAWRIQESRAQDTKMEWKCKICNFSCDRRVRLLRHYRFSHPHQGRHLSFPCLYKDCLVMSKSLGGLKAHMTKNHKTVTLTASHKTSEITYKCSVCHHRVENLFSHLNRHVNVFDKIQCTCDVRARSWKAD